MKSLAAICITKNEEIHLPVALASVKNLATEIIVVDNGSTDNTVTIAKQFTPKVYQQEWLGYGPQKNFAVSNTTCDFVLHIDADEEIPEELAAEIRQILATPQYDYYWLKIITVFLGRPLKNLAGNNLRLFSATHARWNDKLVHEQVIRIKDETKIKFGDQDTEKTKNFILHHSHYQTIAAYLERQEKYSAADAKEMLTTGSDRLGRTVKVNLNNPFSRLYFLHGRAAKQFVRKFFRQRGFLDGWQGWLWCFFSSQYEYKMCRKYLKLIKK